MVRRTDGGGDDLSKRTLAEAEKNLTAQSDAAMQRGTAAAVGGGGSGSYPTGPINQPAPRSYESGITNKDENPSGSASRGGDRPTLPPGQGGNAGEQLTKGTSLPKRG